MSRILEITADIILSVIGFLFICWVFWRALKSSDDPAKILFKCLFSVALVIGEIFFARSLTGTLHPSDAPQANFGQAFVLVGSLAGCGIILSIVWTPQISNFVFSPLTSLFDGGNTPPEPKPYYSIAIAKRKRNKPLEAIIALREQLAKFPNDFEGVMLLANIQAEDLKDLPSAEMTLNHFCEWEKAPPKQVAAAFAQLADWHLKFYQDASSARDALQRIVGKYPGTELALAARERIAHLAGTGKNLLAAQGRQPVFVPEGEKSLGLLPSSAHLVPAETTPAELATAYVQQLKDHPDDTETREKLAILYARHYQRLDLAAIELQQMIEEPNHAPRRVAHWLNLLADLQVHGGADYETVRATLEKIIERFPDFAVAEVARTRLGHLKLEIKGQEKTPEKTLGVYEQNIGLKSNRGWGV
jgi:tetratricopeptide (TPR) repeat protein